MKVGAALILPASTLKSSVSSDPCNTMDIQSEFNRIWKCLEISAIWIGAVTQQKPRIWHRFFYVIVAICTPSMFIQYFWSIFFLSDDILSKVYTTCYLTSAIFLFSTALDAFQFEKEYFILMDWCKSLYGLKVEGLHTFLAESGLRTFTFSLKATKFLMFYSFFNAMLLTGGPIIPTLIFGNEHWITPLEISLPLLPSIDLCTYLINSLVTLLCVIHLVMGTGVTFSLITVAVFHVNFHFSTMAKMIRELGKFDVDGAQFNSWFRNISQMHADTSE